ncbi:MAG: DUF4271 domain-containing protein [Muribaculaceae bacterium]|nr:DUF4271 domain-containing protein [Muribaculaceae bacterium]
MTERLEPMIRQASASTDSGLLIVLTVIMAAAMLCAPVIRRIEGIYFRQLFRSHREAQPGEKTLGERLVVSLALLQTLVFEALMLYCCLGSEAMPPLASLAGLLVLTAGLFAAQMAAYGLTGYAFASADEAHSWRTAALLMQALTGYLLVIPAMGALFYPDYLVLFATIGAMAYISCRIPLIISEFRIFYTTPASLFYFFLYLCTSEIVPLIAVWGLSGMFSSLFC